MSKYLDRAKELRMTTEKHYNCAQATFIPFAEAKGIDTDVANAITSNFGSGMKMASVCGAITGGLMALGLYGADDAETVKTYYARLKENHHNELTCAGLLKIMKEEGGEKGPHCHGMVYEAVTLVENLLTEKGIL